MHLIYKALEGHTLPMVLPPEMISTARIAPAQGPTPTPLAPPSAMPTEPEQVKQQVRDSTKAYLL